MARPIQITVQPTTLLAVLVGFGLGLGLAVAAPALAAKASGSPVSGEWRCYVNDRLPDLDEAAGWRGATKMAEGLNAAAQHTAAGTVVTASYPVASTGFGNASGSTSITCVKS